MGPVAHLQQAFILSGVLRGAPGVLPDTIWPLNFKALQNGLLFLSFSTEAMTAVP